MNVRKILIVRTAGFTWSSSTVIFSLVRYTIPPHIVFRSPYGIVPGGTHDQMGGSMNAFGENHILLFTIFNPLYPITVVSHTSWCVGKY